MMKILILFLVFSISSKVYSKTPSTFSSLKIELQKVTLKNMNSWVYDLVNASLPSRMVGLKGHERAKSFLIGELQKIDSNKTQKVIVSSAQADIDVIKNFYQNDFNQKIEGKISSSTVEYQKWFRFTKHMIQLAESRRSVPVENIVWEKEGIDSSKVLVISAHYDTISHDKDKLLVIETEKMPGANYNASGVAVALGLVQILSQIDLNYSVKVVFLDWQGIGFHGSYQYAKELSKSGKKILGVINLEMLGQDTKYLDRAKKSGNMRLYTRNDDEEIQLANKLINLGTKIDNKVTFDLVSNGFESSDNIRFWEQGIKSVTFSQNWEDDFNPKFYQTQMDTPETLNYETLWHAYQFIGGAVIGTLLDLTK